MSYSLETIEREGIKECEICGRQCKGSLCPPCQAERDDEIAEENGTSYYKR